MRLVRIWRLIALVFCMCLAVVIGNVQTRAEEPMGALWLNRDIQPMMDLDGDGQYDAIEYLDQGGSCVLAFRFGDGRVLGYLLSSSNTIEVIKIDAADFTGNGRRNIVLMAYDHELAQFFFHVLYAGADGFADLPIPDPSTQEDFQYEASFLRGYGMQIRSADESFMLNIQLDPVRYGRIYRDDGTVPPTPLRVSPYQNFAVQPYSVGYALDLRQAVSFGEEEIIVGYMITTLVWRGGEAYLVGQRFEPA